MKRLVCISLILLASGFLKAQPGFKLLIARTVGDHVLSNNDTTRLFGFTESLGNPVQILGPTIVMNENDSFIVDLWNMSQGMPHTIHLHGLDVDQPNDGVPGLSFQVQHTDHGYYYMKAPHAGTYLYHCHVVSAVHVQAGMYGLIIVNSVGGVNTAWTGGPTFNKQKAWMMSEIDVDWHHDSMLTHDTALTAQVPLPKYNPNHFLINGRSNQQLQDTSVQLSMQANSQFYLRMANIGYYGNRVIFPGSLNAQILSSDGRNLPAAEINDTCWIYPGERFGVMLSPTLEFIDSIQIGFQNLNTQQIDSVQYVKSTVSGWQGIQEISTAQVDLYPNPSKDGAIIEVRGDPGSLVKIEIYDLLGKRELIKNAHVPNNGIARIILDLRSLAPGTHITAIQAGKLKAHKKLVKQ